MCGQILISRFFIVAGLTLLPIAQPLLLAEETTVKERVTKKSVRFSRTDSATAIKLADSRATGGKAHKGSGKARIESVPERRTAESLRPKFILHALIDKASTRTRLRNFDSRNINMRDTRLSGDQEVEAFHGILLQNGVLLEQLYISGKSELNFANRSEMRTAMLDTYDRDNPLKPMHFTPIGHHILNDLANRMNLKSAVNALAQQHFPKDEFVRLKVKPDTRSLSEVARGEDSYTKAMQMRFDRQLEPAHEHLRQAADIGHLRAMYELGLNYLYGRGTKKNTAQALKFFEMAGNGGDPRGYFLLGALFGGAQRLKLVTIDHVKSAHNYRRCVALHGQTKVDEKRAKRALGKCYANLGRLAFLGEGMAKDPYMSRRLLWNGADLGEPLAMYFLAFRHLLGEGGKINDYEGIRLLNKAADLGLKSAETAIGKYEEATGKKLRRKQ